MASDEDIAKGLESLFRETNPNSFSSLNEVFLRLQSKLGFDLSHKIDFIRAHVSLLFASPNPNALPLPPPLQPPQHTLFHHPPPPSPHSYFPTGPTEISFALPGSGTLFAESLASPTAKESIQSKPKRRGGPGGLNKLCGVTPQLQAIVGQPALPRTEIVKQLWAYIRKNNLQDPSNKRKIICNDELRLVFEVDCTDMFQMNKLLSKHIVPLDPTKVPEQPSKKAKVEEADVPSTELIAPAAPVTPASPIAPAAAAAASAVTPTTHVPLVISEVLAKFFGTSEKEMPQSEVYTRIEEYIKTEGLEDPLNSMVICDTKLQELLGCESIPSHGICEALARNHLFPRE